jgi:formamidopyrimidine-DNA glycosylase
MPELPEVERVRRRLVPAMVGARFVRVRLHRPDLRLPFSDRFAARLRGTTVGALTRRGKYLLARLDSGETLVMHLGMSGSFRVEPTGSTRDVDPLDLRHDHVTFVMSSGHTVTFNDPRRFGLMQLTDDNWARAAALGPEPLSRAFDASVLASRAAGRRTALKTLLLDQRVVAGLGNIYASEALHLARLSPLRAASTLATSRGRPRPAAVALTSAIKNVLRKAVAARERATYDSARFRVYDREGEPCVTPHCGGVVRRITQGGRSTFYCPRCQH